MLDQILVVIGSVTGQASIIAIVVDAAMRLFKTEKPMSVMHTVSATTHKLADIFAGIANLMDKVFGQKLK